MLQPIGPHLQEFLVSVFRLSLWLSILVAIFVPLEQIFAAHPGKVFRKGMLVDLGYFFLSSLAPALLLGAPIGLLAWLVHRVVPGGFLDSVAALPLWARVLAGFVAGEVGYYWGHRLSHQIPYLWQFHAIHHSAEHVDFLVNTRAHPIDLVFGRFCSLVPIYILGLGGPIGASGSTVPVLATLFGTVWGFFIHANLKWRFGPLEWLISTPAFHHWHHTRTGPINRNYSSTLPWLDLVFGTHHLPRQEWPSDYGIKAKVPETLVGQLLYPWSNPYPIRENAPAPTEAAPAPVGVESQARSDKETPSVAAAPSV